MAEYGKNEYGKTTDTGAEKPMLDWQAGGELAPDPPANQSTKSEPQIVLGLERGVPDRNATAGQAGQRQSKKRERPIPNRNDR